MHSLDKYLKLTQTVHSWVCLGEKERRQSMLPNLSKSISQKPNYLTVPNTTGGGGTASGGSGTGGMIKNAFNRLVSGNW